MKLLAASLGLGLATAFHVDVPEPADGTSGFENIAQLDPIEVYNGPTTYKYVFTDTDGNFEDGISIMFKSDAQAAFIYPSASASSATDLIDTDDPDTLSLVTEDDTVCYDDAEWKKWLLVKTDDSTQATSCPAFCEAQGLIYNYCMKGGERCGLETQWEQDTVECTGDNAVTTATDSIFCKCKRWDWSNWSAEPDGGCPDTGKYTGTRTCDSAPEHPCEGGETKEISCGDQVCSDNAEGVRGYLHKVGNDGDAKTCRDFCTEQKGANSVVECAKATDGCGANGGSPGDCNTISTRDKDLICECSDPDQDAGGDNAYAAAAFDVEPTNALPTETGGTFVVSTTSNVGFACIAQSSTAQGSGDPSVSQVRDGNGADGLPAAARLLSIAYATLDTSAVCLEGLTASTAYHVFCAMLDGTGSVVPTGGLAFTTTDPATAQSDRHLLEDNECQVWGDYGEWEECDAECGGGKQIRRRECADTNAARNRHLLEGDAEKSWQKRECNKQACPLVLPGDAAAPGKGAAKCVQVTEPEWDNDHICQVDVDLSQLTADNDVEISAEFRFKSFKKTGEYDKWGVKKYVFTFVTKDLEGTDAAKDVKLSADGAFRSEQLAGMEEAEVIDAIKEILGHYVGEGFTIEVEKKANNEYEWKIEVQGLENQAKLKKVSEDMYNDIMDPDSVIRQDEALTDFFTEVEVASLEVEVKDVAVDGESVDMSLYDAGAFNPRLGFGLVVSLLCLLRFTQ